MPHQNFGCMFKYTSILVYKLNNVENVLLFGLKPALLNAEGIFSHYFMWNTEEAKSMSFHLDKRLHKALGNLLCKHSNENCWSAVVAYLTSWQPHCWGMPQSRDKAEVKLVWCTPTRQRVLDWLCQYVFITTAFPFLIHCSDVGDRRSGKCRQPIDRHL